MSPLPPAFEKLIETGSEETRAFLQNVCPVVLTREPEELPPGALDNLCWIWQGAAGTEGFAYAGRESVQRRAYRLLVGAIPEGLRVERTCRGRLCVNPRHLRLATNSEIMSRAGLPGRLSDGDREDVKKALASGEPQTSVARRFGVSQPAVSAIKNRPEFAEAPGEQEPARTLAEWLDRQDRRLGPVGQLARGEAMGDDQREKALSKATREFLTYQLLVREYDARRGR